MQVLSIRVECRWSRGGMAAYAELDARYIQALLMKLVIGLLFLELS